MRGKLQWWTLVVISLCSSSCNASKWSKCYEKDWLLQNFPTNSFTKKLKTFKLMWTVNIFSLFWFERGLDCAKSENDKNRVRLTIFWNGWQKDITKLNSKCLRNLKHSNSNVQPFLIWKNPRLTAQNYLQMSETV